MLVGLVFGLILYLKLLTLKPNKPMAILLLKQSEHDELRDLRTFDKDVEVLFEIERITGYTIQVDEEDTFSFDVNSNAQRAAVLASPLTLRKSIAVSPRDYYKLFLIAHASNSTVLKSLMKDCFVVVEAGFPIALTPMDTVFECPVHSPASSVNHYYFIGARPNTSITLTVYDNAGAVITTATLTADADGAGFIPVTYVAYAGGYVIVESVQTVVTAAENGIADVIATVRVKVLVP